jgi:BMFP domain-containing protein YqiC
MFDSKLFDDLAKKLFSALPVSLQQLENDLQQKFKDILQAAFTHMNLVSREEFDVQAKVLVRTREKVDQLQTQLQHWIEQQSKAQDK